MLHSIDEVKQVKFDDPAPKRSGSRKWFGRGAQSEELRIGKAKDGRRDTWPLRVQTSRGGSFEAPKQPPSIKTSTRHLSEVLGRVVEIVVEATVNGHNNYDCSELEALISNLEKVDPKDDEVCLTHEELAKVVTRVVQSAKESVTKKTKVPTGICISNFGSKRCCVDLYWGKQKRQSNVGKAQAKNS